MMKHVAKKGVALLLTLCMILTVFPVNVLADSRTEKSYVIPQFVMETTASSQETVSDENSSKNAIDGDSGTIWHTQWSGVGASAPHWIKVDLKKNYTVSGLTYLPRQDDSMNGQVTKYEIFYSSDDVNYTSAISGNWENNKEEKIADFAPVSARYIKLQSAGTFMSCAELNIKTVDDMYSNLWEAWREAEKLAGVAVIGDQPEQYPKDAVDALYAAIKEAKLAIADSELDEETASAVTEMLKNAMIVFRNAVNCYTWDQFSDLIAEAEELIRDVEVGTEEGQVPQEAMDFIENAVSEAKKITNNSDKKVIHQGYLALFQSMTEFRGYIASNLISLEGEWQLKLGPYAEGDADKILDDICILPGTLDENQKGNISSGFDQNKLNRKYKYTGAAVYQKVVYIPEFWEGKQNTLLLERTKLTRVWVNGVEQTECNTNDSIGTPQVYTLNGLIPGQLNTITIEVKNTDYKIPTRSHMLTEETVTNWNGMIGRMELAAVDSVSVDAVRCYPDIQNKTVTVEVTLNNITGNDVSGILNISAESYNHEGIIHKPEELNKSFSMKAAEKVKEFRFTYDMGDDVRLWSEFDPDLYHLTVSLDAESFHDAKTVSFGMREIGTKERKFTINGTKTFLRGEGNSAVFPLTGYPFMTKEEWTEFFKTAQELGINFFRFHSWTPPEAAFEAADELGVYMQPELYGFGEQANWGTNHYYYSEAKRIL